MTVGLTGCCRVAFCFLGMKQRGILCCCWREPRVVMLCLTLSREPKHATAGDLTPVLYPRSTEGGVYLSVVVGRELRAARHTIDCAAATTTTSSEKEKPIEVLHLPIYAAVESHSNIGPPKQIESSRTTCSWWSLAEKRSGRLGVVYCFRSPTTHIASFARRTPPPEA